MCVQASIVPDWPDDGQCAEQVAARLRVLQKAARHLRDSNNKDGRSILEKLSKAFQQEPYLEDFILRLLRRSKPDFMGGLVRAASNAMLHNEKRLVGACCAPAMCAAMRAPVLRLLAC